MRCIACRQEKDTLRLTNNLFNIYICESCGHSKIVKRNRILLNCSGGLKILDLLTKKGFYNPNYVTGYDRSLHFWHAIYKSAKLRNEIVLAYNKR